MTDSPHDPGNWLTNSVSRIKAAAKAETTPPTAQLVVKVSGQPAHTHDLSGDTIRVGRGEDTDISLDIPFLSLHQLVLTRSNDTYRLEPSPDATVPLVYQGRPVVGKIDLKPGAFFRLTGENAGEMVTFVFDTTKGLSGPIQGTIQRKDVTALKIGSALDNDLGVDNPLIQPHHAEIAQKNGVLELQHVQDDSTLVNGKPILGSITLNPGDKIRIGSLTLDISADEIRYVDRAGGMLLPTRRGRALPEDLLSRMEGVGGVLIEALHLNKVVRKDVNLLQDISLRIRPREFVVLVGLSGAGKSTLMDAIAGYRPATEGQVLIDGVDLYQHFDTFRPTIGFVPQRDIVHMDLTVFEALDYAAQLRMPPNTTATERHQRVNEVMADLGLVERRDVKISLLSGGQLKRVSIGVELITKPNLFFLDEPTSGLDPGTETGLMQLLRNLADQGRTIILITHATKNVMLADKVIFMVRGGRIAWFGPPDEALDYFSRQRPAREQRDKRMEFDRIYSLLEDPAMGSPQDWADRYKADVAYQKYIVAPLKLTTAGPNGAAKEAAIKDKRESKPAPAAVPQISSFRQFQILVARNLRLLTRDRFALVLMLIAAPLLAMLDFLIATRDMYDPTFGDALRITITVSTLAVDALLVGALAQMREIIKDTDIYRRERLVNLRIAPYVMSKVGVAVILAMYQALAWVVIRYLAVKMPGDFSTALGVYVTLSLTVLAGMMLGLFASAIAPSADSVALIVALLIVPQVLFSGALLPLPKLSPIAQTQTTIMPSRWAFEALTSESGAGKTLVADACWQLPKDQRDSLTDAQKQSCTCMGVNIFSKCDFPGIRAYYNPAVDKPEPQPPTAPVIGTLKLADPPKPNATSLLNITKYISDLDTYSQNTKSQIENFSSENTTKVQNFVDALKQYKDDYQTWQTARSTAIKSAEARLEVEYDNFSDIYNVNVPSRWLALIAIIVSLTAIILGIQKLKDVI